MRKFIALFLLLVLFVMPVIARPQDPNRQAQELFDKAAKLYNDGKFDEALPLCLKAIELNPNDYRPRAMAGFIYTFQRKYKSASDALAEAIRLEPRRKEFHLIKAKADQFRNARADAIAAARKAIEVDPNYAEAYAFLGGLIGYSKGQSGEAISALRTAIKLNPKLLAAYETLGEILVYTKDEKGAEEAFRQGIAADPKRMVGRFDLGRLLVKQGRIAEARKLWDKRTSDQDNTIPSFIEELEREEKLERAKESLAKKPDDPKALVEMGLAVMEGDHWVVDGRQKRALVYFRKALELKPDFARAQYGVVKAYIQGVDYPKDESKIVDEELAKLRTLDTKLADELEEYRRKFVRGFPATPVKADQ